MKPISLMISLLIAGLPVQAQLDKEWKDQNAGKTECRVKRKQAQYGSSGIYLYLIEGQTILRISASGACYFAGIGKLNVQQGINPLTLYKIEGDELVVYEKYGRLEVKRRVVAVKL